MRRPNLDEDVQPVSEFRANAAKFVQRVRETRRPLVLTQHGKSAAVLMDVGEYEKMLETIDHLRAVSEGERRTETGRGVASDEAGGPLPEEHEGG